MAKAVSAQCVLLRGSDGLRMVQVLSDIVRAHKASGGDVTPEAFAADSRPPSDWIGLASSASFFADIQVVVVRSLGRVNPAKTWDAKATKSHPFAQAVLGLPDFARLILVADEEVGGPDKATQVKENADRWTKIVEHAGAFVPNLETDAATAVKEIEEAAKDRGLKLSKAAAQKLSLMVGGQVGLALAELEKAEMYISPRKDLREADIDRIVTPEPDYNVFQYTEAIMRGDSGAALRELSHVTGGNPSSLAGEAISRILPMVQRQLRLLWQARLCVDAGCHPSSAPESVLARFPDRPNLGREKDWLQSRLMTSARSLTLTQLSACFQELSSADCKLKGILPYFSPQETLETMTLRMAECCRPSRRS